MSKDCNTSCRQRPAPPPPSPTPTRIRRPPPPPPRRQCPVSVSPPTLPPRPKPSPARVPPPVPPRILPSQPPTPLQHVDPQQAQFRPSDSLVTTGMAPNQHGQFYKAHNFRIKNAQFNDFSLVGLGLEKLLKDSMPDAFHDSAARYPPPKCHLGTRKEYISEITDWALGKSEHKERVLWMRGPFGIGKTAVAQSSAEALKRIDKLLATLFFSRSNANRNDPRRVFPSLVYQITTLCKEFAIIIDARVREDLALTTKSLATQFEELLVNPLTQIDAAATGLEGRTIIIDGLDECEGTSEQCEIIRIIANSARNGTTPFRWFITSRPEDPIIRSMNIPAISSTVYCIELSVSREIDHEILLFLTDEFTKIRESHGLPDPWPSDEVLALLVERGAGLWIYVSIIVRFINDENSLGPVDQLRIVRRFLGDVLKKVEPNNPLAEMDFFYTLIMQRIPPNIRKMVQRIIFLHSVGYLVPGIVCILGLFEEQLHRYCVFIQSVMELRGSSSDHFSPDRLQLHFYHASFIDYLTDHQRSGDMCINGEFLIHWRKELLEWLHFVCTHTTNSSQFIFPDHTSLPVDLERGEHYRRVVKIFWTLFARPDHQIDISTAASISNLSFQKMLRLIPVGQSSHIYNVEVQHLWQNLPIEFREKIIRRERCPTPECTASRLVWILGNGGNAVVIPTNLIGDLRLETDQHLPDHRCQCGAYIGSVGNEDIEEDDAPLVVPRIRKCLLPKDYRK
ncbi:hypothetical protein NP233_g8073 [Leucocoprinus birnbaumii]|uniref:Nephrocystin 3-like N-terminal domain-containing protein n=1 Tax=Leucocoprinus birnbaumii TaxID=56174 RepID=A0AAD5VN07_9AGAR|nr:hypothetical protein NP233_g8073 [Leucocoprinus birnbaumii]